ncbi:hypothetical protein R1flu_004938 [Riccia fluitans]|uniref:procollagen-proline 4-dioxygenase n=1 Tax=Riccia fluitans TaxID=41844 RepID=A0ABD1YUK3_9MARC
MASGMRGHRVGISSRARSMITLAMIFAVLLLVLLILVIVGAPSALNSAAGHGSGATIALKIPQVIRGQKREKEDPAAVLVPYVEPLSWKPRIFLYHNMLTDEECEHLIKLARPNMQKSTVVDSATGRSKDSRVRTSSGTFLNRGQDPIIAGIEKKIADFTFVPVEHGEGLQVLHYEVGQKYEAHYDYFHDSFNTKNGGQRIATVLMYLSDVEAGGETVFPAVQVNSSQVPHWDTLSECAKGGLSVRPKKGMALLFWSMAPDVTLDSRTLHGGCPVIAGNKWSATKWLHVNTYSVPS